MGTRSGDIDPAIIRYLMDQTDMNIGQIDTVLNNKSGLKGICGYNDMRDIQERAAKGDTRATLSVEMFCYQVKQKIGSYLAVLGKVDALVFTGGVGENDSLVRFKICDRMSFLGIGIDPVKNKQSNANPFPVRSTSSRVQIWIIPTNEEFQIASEVIRIIQ